MDDSRAERTHAPLRQRSKRQNLLLSSQKRRAHAHTHGWPKSERGQAVVEAAFLTPALLLSLLLLIQPGILLYTRMVMEGAAAEGCRILATTSDLEQGTDTVEGFIKRRLASVPQQQNFHVHDPACSWVITLNGDESATQVSIQITNEIKPLPLFDFGLEALGVLNEHGNYELTVSKQLITKSVWVQGNTLSNDPEQWIERWNAS